MENWAKWADGVRGGGGMLRDSTFLFSHLTNKRSLWACATTHKHTPTQRSKTLTHAQIQTCTTPTIYMRPLQSTHRFQHTHTRTHMNLLLFFLNIALLSALHNKTQIATFTSKHCTESYPTIIGSSHTGKSSGFDWTWLRTCSNEPPHVLYRVCSK